MLALEPHFVAEIEAARAKEFTALCHYAYLNGIQRSTYELIAVIVSMVTFAVHSLRGLPLELGTVMPALLLRRPPLGSRRAVSWARCTQASRSRRLP